MGDKEIRVVPDHMAADATKWSGAADSLRRAVAAVPPLDIDFGRFQASVGETYAVADRAARRSIVTGEKRLGAMAANVEANFTRTRTDDEHAGVRVDGAGRGGGGTGAGGGGGGAGAGAGGQGDQTGQPGGRPTDHYETTLGPVPTPMPADPRDPDVTFERHVDPETGAVTWTRRLMEPGEAVAGDGRDVERVPERADRVVVTMVDGEPRITYVDSTEEPGGPRVESAALVPESGLAPAPPRTEWSRPLPEGADYAVVEVRDGVPHLVLLDVEDGRVSELGDVVLRGGEPTAPTPDLMPTGVVR